MYFDDWLSSFSDSFPCKSWNITKRLGSPTHFSFQICLESGVHRMLPYEKRLSSLEVA